MNQSVLITGVSSGLGEAMATHYLQAGARVFGVSRRPPTSLIDHAEFRFISADLRDFSAIPAVFERLLDGEGPVDLAILNAGILGHLGDMQETSVDHLRATMTVNVWSNKVILDDLLGGNRVSRQVVTISSGAAVNGSRGFGGYSISKAALNMLTKLYSRECPAIHFCALAPGVIETAMQESISEEAADPRFVSFHRLRDMKASGTMLKPHEAASSICRVIELLPERVDSGDFADIREERFDDTYPRR